MPDLVEHRYSFSSNHNPKSSTVRSPEPLCSRHSRSRAPQAPPSHSSKPRNSPPPTSSWRHHPRVDGILIKERSSKGKPIQYAHSRKRSQKGTPAQPPKSTSATSQISKAVDSQRPVSRTTQSCKQDGLLKTILKEDFMLHRLVKKVEGNDRLQDEDIAQLAEAIEQLRIAGNGACSNPGNRRPNVSVPLSSSTYVESSHAASSAGSVNVPYLGSAYGGSTHRGSTQHSSTHRSSTHGGSTQRSSTCCNSNHEDSPHGGSTYRDYSSPASSYNSSRTTSSSRSSRSPSWSSVF